MPETVRTYTTEHGTVYTQKIITDGAGKIVSEVWMKGSKALKDGVYISPEHADKAKSYFNKHLERKNKKEVETFALKIIKDLKTLSYPQTKGSIVFFDDRFYRTSVVKKVSPGFDSEFSERDIEETLLVPDDKKSGSELEDSLAGDLALSSDQNYYPPQPKKDYNPPLLNQIKPDSKVTLKPQTKPAQKKGILSKLSPFSIFKKQAPKKKNR